MYTVELPYNKGTFVKIISPYFDIDRSNIGTVVGYSVFSPTDITIHISGYKDSWCGEYLLDDIRMMTDEEIEQIKIDR